MVCVGHTRRGGAYYDQAIEQERKTLELDPNFNQALVELGLVYVQKSIFKEGIAEFEQALAISLRSPTTLPDLGYAYGLAGRRAEAQKVLDQLSELSKQRYVQLRLKARVYVGLGDKDKAFEYLEQGYEDRSLGSAFGTIKTDPSLDSLRSDPRFSDQLRRMNFTQ